MDCSALIIVFNLQFCIEFTLTTLYALCYLLFHLQSTRYALKALTLHVPPFTLYALHIYEFISSRIFYYSLYQLRGLKKQQSDKKYWVVSASFSIICNAVIFVIVIYWLSLLSHI